MPITTFSINSKNVAAADGKPFKVEMTIDYLDNNHPATEDIIYTLDAGSGGVTFCDGSGSKTQTVNTPLQFNLNVKDTLCLKDGTTRMVGITATVQSDPTFSDGLTVNYTAKAAAVAAPMATMLKTDTKKKKALRKADKHNNPPASGQK
jgi:hypothetical protein